MAISLLLCSGPLWMAAHFQPWILRSWSQNYFTTGSLLSCCSSWRQAPWDRRPVLFSQLNTCGYSPYITSSLTRGWVCFLHWLLALACAVFLGPSPSGLMIIFYCLRFEIPPNNLEDQVPVFISPRNSVVQLYPQALGSLYIAS
jgi:hypothetical protein